jgi:hypothetical protein
MRAGLKLEGRAIATPESERPAQVPSVAEAANPRSYLPVEYDRVQGLGTVVPAQLRKDGIM